MANPTGTEMAGTRNDFVDALRGYALLGLFLVHMCELFELWWANPYPDSTHDAIFLIFAGKSYALLALCFGFSFHAMAESCRRRGVRFAPFFARRVILLAVMGWLHGLIYRGDIIFVLASLGLLLIPFITIRSKTVLALLAAMFFAGPLLLVRIAAGFGGAEWANAVPLFMLDKSMPAYLHGSFADNLRVNLWAGFIQKWSFFIEFGRAFHIFGWFLVGLLLGRNGWFAQQHTKKVHGALVAIFAILSVIAYWANGLIGAAYGSAADYQRYIPMLFSGWEALAMTGLSLVLLHALWQCGGRVLLGWLAAPGRMTLTLYIGQSLVFVPFFYGYGSGAWEWISQPEALALGLLSFAIQAVFAHWYFARFHYGPLEWLWRAATRGTTDIPMRKRNIPGRPAVS